MTTEVRQQIDAELKKAGISEVRSEMVIASAEQREMRISSVQKTETAIAGKPKLGSKPMVYNRSTEKKYVKVLQEFEALFRENYGTLG